MKIGINARSLVPGLTGIGRYVLEMSRHLALKGHEVFLYLPEKATVPLPNWPGVTIRVGNRSGGIERLIWEQTVLPKLAATDGVDVFWGPAHRLPLLLDKRIARVLTIHDLVWIKAASTMRFRTWLAESVFMRPSLRFADIIVADSRATADALEEFFPHFSGKLKVVYPGVTRISEREGRNLPSELVENLTDRPYALFVGTLEPRKNLRRLLLAYASLSEADRCILSLVVTGGQGWRLGSLEKLIDELGVSSTVRLTGYVSDDELADLYSNARFLVMPSLYEGFGFPIIEANAAGKPVLTSNVASMPEVAGDTALLVDPLDTKAIASALLRLLHDGELYRRLTSKACSNAARFDWETSADEILELFEDAIKQRSANL